MLPAAHRLRHRDEFAAAIRGGRRAGRGTVVVHLMIPAETAPVDDGLAATDAGSSAEPARVQVRAGFVVPKTVGTAVARNTVKRRLRHLVRDRLPDLPPGSDLVVRALPGAAARAYPQLASDLDAALTAARTRRPAKR